MGMFRFRMIFILSECFSLCFEGGAGSPALYGAMAASQALCSPRLYAVIIRSIFDCSIDFLRYYIEGYFGFGDTNDTAIHFFDFVRL